MTKETLDSITVQPKKKKEALSKVTTVYLPPQMYSLSNAEKNELIKSWLDTVDTNILVENALLAMLQDHQAGSRKRYAPIKFVYDFHAPMFGSGNTAALHEDAYGEDAKASIRMRPSLYDRVIHAAESLSTTPSDVIKLALAKMYLDNGAGLIQHIKELHKVPDFHPLERKNSTSFLRKERNALKSRLGKETDPKMIAHLEEKIAAIKV
jgi:hypothetical protein|tara:strand:- start:14572 stop:15198 length:627 start_codon:yes stop_codon:yes gene_type:complete